MTREEFMEHAGRKIDAVLGSRKNRIMNLYSRHTPKGGAAQGDSFPEVVRQWRRMCETNQCTVSGDGKNDFPPCPLADPEIHDVCREAPQDWADWEAEKLAKIVMQWAKENPEPVTWGEWLVSRGIAMSVPVTDEYPKREIIVNRDKTMPPEVAKALREALKGTDMDMNYPDISLRVSKPALYEQLAEECTELAHAALKMARFLRGENPTPVDYGAIIRAVDEEYTDVRLVADVLELRENKYLAQAKLMRWSMSLDDAETE